MYQKSRRFQTKIITYAVLVIFSLLVIGVFVYSYVSKYQGNKLDIKSRYTFSIIINSIFALGKIYCYNSGRIYNWCKSFLIYIAPS
jgi:hypothetical protein